MKPNLQKLLFTMLLFVLTLSFAGAQEGPDSLIGIISAARDAAGAVTGITLEAETYDDNDNVVTLVYQLEMNDMARQLAENYDGAEVKVTGQIKIAADNEKTIAVTAFEGTSEEVPMEPVDTELLPHDDLPDIDSGSEGDIEGDIETGNETE